MTAASLPAPEAAAAAPTREEIPVSKSHPEQWAVHEVTGRPDRSLVTALREFDTTQIADCGGPVAIMAPPLRHLAGGTQLCGPAVTVWTKPGDILYVLKAPDLITAGDVLVVDGGGRLDAAVIGDIAGQALAGRGCDGMVVDGAVRDLGGLDVVGLPTFAAGAHPATGSVQGPGAINVVVQCGGVTVRPGDVIRGDASGLVVVPREHLTSVLALTKAVADREEGWRQAIAGGASLAAAAGIDDLISKLAAERAAAQD
jgi:4-hydroxy-4-methyl-2-oxoglutarate aldolase